MHKLKLRDFRGSSKTPKTFPAISTTGRNDTSFLGLQFRSQKSTVPGDFGVRICHERDWEHKEVVRCTFCRGPNCMRCGITAYQVCKDPAFPGLHSNWISDEVLAMQRPADEIIEQQNLVSLFKENKIHAIFNLTEPGEHPYCGLGIKKSGFPYTPEKFMEGGIKHYNFAWRDMTTPSPDMMMNIIRIALSEIRAGNKIAIHCHAGFGRTGIVAACVLIALNHITADDAIILVRSKRPGSIQTPAQQSFVEQFASDYRNLCSIFPVNNPSAIKNIDRSSRDEALSIPVEYLRPPMLAKVVQHCLHVLRSACSESQQATVNAITGVRPDPCEGEDAVDGHASIAVNEHLLVEYMMHANNCEWGRWEKLKLRRHSIRVDQILHSQLTISPRVDTSDETMSGEMFALPDIPSPSKQGFLSPLKTFLSKDATVAPMSPEERLIIQKAADTPLEEITKAEETLRLNAALLFEWLDTRSDGLLSREFITAAEAVLSKHDVSTCMDMEISAEEASILTELDAVMRKYISKCKLQLLSLLVDVWRHLVRPSEVCGADYKFLALLRLAISAINVHAEVKSSFFTVRTMKYHKCIAFAKYCLSQSTDAEVPNVDFSHDVRNQLKASVCLLQLLISRNWEYSFTSAKVHWNPDVLRSAKLS